MHPLDQPIWNALTGLQAHFAEVSGSARRFPPAVTMLGALESIDDAAYASLASIQKPGEVTALFLQELPKPPTGWTLVRTMPLLQMVHERNGSGNSRQMTQEGTSYLPLKVNTAGVIPIIFAMSIQLFPATFAQFFPPGASKFGDWLHLATNWLQPLSIDHAIVFSRRARPTPWPR